MSKCCSRCNKTLSESEFRIKTDKRCTPVLVYLNSTCLICDNELQTERYHKNRNNDTYKKKHAQWAKNAYQRNKEVIKQRMKNYRNSDAGKLARAKYVEKNKEKIQLQERITKRRYQVKHMDNLTDEYVISKLIGISCKLNKQDFLSYPEIIEAKRLHIKIQRLINNNQK